MTSVKLRLESELLDDRIVVETPWADDLGDGLYRLDNSPWWRGDLSWRDVVRAEEHFPGDFPVVTGLAEPGGHATFRLLFDARVGGRDQRAVLEALNERGATYEWTGGEREGLYAIDVGPEAEIGEVEALLRRCADDGLLEYELGGTVEFMTRLDAAMRTENWTVRHPEPLVPSEDAELLLVEELANELFEGYAFEQLWGRPRGEDYELLSAAFAAYELQVGDVVSVQRRERRLPRITGVRERSDRWLLRAIVVEDRADPGEVTRELVRRGARVERSALRPGYLAVDAGEAEVDDVRTWLQAEEDGGTLSFETAWP